MPDQAFSAGAVLAPSGRLLAHGMTDAGLRAYGFGSDLALDPTFGDAGSVLLDVDAGAPQNVVGTGTSLTVDASGRIYVTAPSPNPRVHRLLPNGELDTTFGVGGRADLPGHDAGVAIGVMSFLESDGKLLVVRPPEIRRLTVEGRLDPTFGNDGVLVLPKELTAVWGAGLQSDGRLVLAGGTYEVWLTRIR